MKHVALILCLALAPVMGVSAGHVEFWSNAHNYRLRVTGIDELNLRDFHSLQVRLFCPGSSCATVALEVSARMPEHGHGSSYRPRVTCNAGGACVVEGLRFHMPGYWEIYFDIADEQDATIERAQIGIEL